MKVAMLGVKGVPAIGGIAAYTEEVGARLAARGHEVTVYCRPHYLSNGRERWHRGMERRLTGGMRTKHLETLTHTLSGVLDAVDRGFDVLHFHGAGPAALAPMARALSRARIVVTIHGFEWESSKWGRGAKLALRAADRMCLRSADAVTVVSHTMWERYARRGARRAAVIPPGVTEPRPRPPELIRRWGLGEGDYLLFLGRLVPEKGCDVLLRAYRGLRTDKRLVVAGAGQHDGAYEEELRRLADERVIFAGYVEGDLKAELLTSAYLFVQPSRLEGLSIAVLEAMSYGRLVVASDLPGNREALGRFGVLFGRGDVEGLREALGSCLARPEAVAAQGPEGAEWVRREHSWERTAERLERLYVGLMPTRGLSVQVRRAGG